MLSKEEYSNIMNLARSDINNQHLAIFLLQSKGFSLNEITWFLIDNAKLDMDPDGHSPILLPDSYVTKNCLIITYDREVTLVSSNNASHYMRLHENQDWSNLTDSQQQEIFDFVKEYISNILNGTN